MDVRYYHTLPNTMLVRQRPLGEPVYSNCRDMFA